MRQPERQDRRGQDVVLAGCGFGTVGIIALTLGGLAERLPKRLTRNPKGGSGSGGNSSSPALEWGRGGQNL